ncbi:aminotransferase class I/II-fold pyridoxal phosphate-dependent enzyme [Fibrobacterota bacterium]
MTIKKISELASFNGRPFFNRKLHVGQPNIGNRENLIRRINKILDKKWLTNAGPYVQKFERQIAEYVGVKHCIAMCNGTIALENAIRALDLSGEVIVPSFTFVATPNSLQWQEIAPVFCDINPETFTIDPMQIERLITPRTTGIIGVHLWGRICDIDKLSEVAEHYKLKLLFDAAHSFGCSYKGKMIGGFGELEVFSFHATKFLNTLEGGAVVTNNDNLAVKIRLMKNFGFTDYDKVDYIGVNGKMNEISAAMGITGLESIEYFIDTNKTNFNLYQKELEGLKGIKVLPYNESEKCNYQYVVLTINEKTAQISRDQLISLLHSENILARKYFYPGCHRMEPYRSFFPHAGLLLPQTERMAEKTVVLPTGTSINKDDIANICDIIKIIINNAPEIQLQASQIKKQNTMH